jgi:hypothetical protein
LPSLCIHSIAFQLVLGTLKKHGLNDTCQVKLAHCKKLFDCVGYRIGGKFNGWEYDSHRLIIRLSKLRIQALPHTNLTGSLLFPNQIDAILTFFAASQYPYLIPYVNELYIPSSITSIYSAVGAAAILLSISTAIASYKSSTNYVLVVSALIYLCKDYSESNFLVLIPINKFYVRSHQLEQHACITGVFLPFVILVYFSSLSSRYKVSDYQDDYKKMIADYRVASKQIKLDKQNGATSNPAPVETVDVTAGPPHQTVIVNSSGEQIRPTKFISFINLIDSIQSKVACCGVESAQDWTVWKDYIPPSCCSNPATTINSAWSEMFGVDKEYEFEYCTQAKAHHLGCLAALKEDENGKFAWLSNLIVFLMVLTITDTILALLLYGLSKTENMPYDVDENELAMVGVSMKPRPSRPEITGIRHRPSVVQTLGPSKEQIASISHAVRFNLANSPRGSISGPSKFSAAARRGSALV